MHVETYSAFFTPREKEPSFSSSEKKSLEFDWLESKITRKQKYEGKTEQVLCKIYFLQNCTRDSIDNIFDMLYRGNYKLYIRVYSPFFQT